MPVGGKTSAVLLLAGLALGVLLVKRYEIFPPVRKPAALSAVPAESARRPVSAWLRVRGLRIRSADGSAGLWIGESTEGGPGIWMTNARKTATIEAGVHGNGFPYLLVSDLLSG